MAARTDTANRAIVEAYEIHQSWHGQGCNAKILPVRQSWEFCQQCMKKAFQVNLKCSARARRFWSVQKWAKLLENLEQQTSDPSLKGNLQSPALTKQRKIEADFVSLGTFGRY